MWTLFTFTPNYTGQKSVEKAKLGLRGESSPLYRYATIEPKHSSIYSSHIGIGLTFKRHISKHSKADVWYAGVEESHKFELDVRKYHKSGVGAKIAQIGRGAFFPFNPTTQ